MNSNPLEQRLYAATAKTITEIMPNDILLGRGAVSIGNEGNIRFRSLVKDRQEEYVSTSRRKKKKKIAEEVRSAVEKRNGRFLRRAECGSEMTATGISSKTETWLEADEMTIMQKIKQSLRERDTDSESDGSTPEPGSHLPSQDRLSPAKQTKRDKTDDSVARADTKRHILQGQNLSDASEPNHVSRLPTREADLHLPARNPTEVAAPTTTVHLFHPFATEQPHQPPTGTAQSSPHQMRSRTPSFQDCNESSTDASQGPEELRMSSADRRLWLYRQRQLLILETEKDRERTMQRLHQQDELLRDLREAHQQCSLQLYGSLFVASSGSQINEEAL